MSAAADMAPFALDEQIATRIAPNDLKAERAILAELLIYPEKIESVAGLRPEHFYSEAHRRIFEAILAVHEAATLPDIITVIAWLRDHDRLAQVGGNEYVAEIAGHPSYPSRLGAWANLVLGAWRDRERIAACRRATDALYDRGPNTDAVIAAAAACLASTEPRQKTPTHPAEIVERWRSEGPLEHAPTGFPTLDEACGGGLTVPRRVVIVGAPGSGKTALGLILVSRYVAAGFVAGVHGIDEDDDDLNVRLAQRAGFTVAQCESRSQEQLERIEAELAGLPLHFYDSAWTIEDATADLAKRAKAAGRRAVYFGDSVQTIRCAASLALETPREIVEANVRASRIATTEHRLLTLMTSEANRASYRNDDAAEQSNDMAAGAESRVIEFSAQTLLMLRTPKGHADVVRVTVPKNRRGRAGFEFFLRLDRDRHELTECSDPTNDPGEVQREQSERRARNRRALDADAIALAAIIRESPGIGERALRAAVKLAGLRWGRDTLDAAKGRLEAGVQGVRMVNRGTPTAAAYFVDTIPTGSES